MAECQGDKNTQNMCSGQEWVPGLWVETCIAEDSRGSFLGGEGNLYVGTRGFCLQPTRPLLWEDKAPQKLPSTAGEGRTGGGLEGLSREPLLP